MLINSRHFQPTCCSQCSCSAMTSGAGEEPSWRQSEGEVLFEMLDKDKDGFLNQKEARTWLRSLGWCLVDEALDTLLKEAQTEAPRKKDISSPDHKKWVLPELINAADLGQDLCGPHPEALQSAFRALGAQSTCSKDCFKQLATGHEGGLTEADVEDLFALCGVPATQRQAPTSALMSGLVDCICQPKAHLHRGVLGHTRHFLG